MIYYTVVLHIGCSLHFYYVVKSNYCIANRLCTCNTFDFYEAVFIPRTQGEECDRSKDKHRHSVVKEILVLSHRQKVAKSRKIYSTQLFVHIESWIIL